MGKCHVYSLSSTAYRTYSSAYATSDESTNCKVIETDGGHRRDNDGANFESVNGGSGISVLNVEMVT